MSFRPSRLAKLKYQDERIKVYSDGTWKAVMKGEWQVSKDAVIHANGAGDVSLTTGWGHNKTSHVIAPDGTAYDVRKLATETTTG